jgi:hypothetical protein
MTMEIYNLKLAPELCGTPWTGLVRLFKQRANACLIAVAHEELVSQSILSPQNSSESDAVGDGIAADATGGDSRGGTRTPQQAPHAFVSQLQFNPGPHYRVQPTDIVFVLADEACPAPPAAPPESRRARRGRRRRGRRAERTGPSVGGGGRGTPR